jgi:hypothetical protein
VPPSANSSSQSGLFYKAAGIAAVVAVLRFFLKGWLAPLGVPTVVGSFLASITIVLIVTLILIFLREGRKADGRFLNAAAWFSGFAAWYQILVICGILLTERSGADTYYTGPWEMAHKMYPTATAHAIGHAQGIIIMIIMGLVVGGIIYALAKRGRATASAQAGA